MFLFVNILVKETLFAACVTQSRIFLKSVQGKSMSKIIFCGGIHMMLKTT